MASGTAMAFDYGKKRIGVAVGELSLGQAHPLSVIAASPRSRCYAAIDALIAEWQPSILVLGLPGHTEARPHPHPLAAQVRRFGDELSQRYRLPLTFADETLTSAVALDDATNWRVGGSRRGSDHLDALAAQQILMTWFSLQPVTDRRLVLCAA